MAIQWPIVAAVACFLMLLAGVGDFVKKKVTTDEDYLVGGRSVGPVFTAVSFCVAYYSTVAVIGCPAMYYLYGMGYASLELLANTWIVGILLFVVLGLRMRVVSERANVVSLPGFLAVRFESETLRLVSACIIAIFVIPYGVAVLKGIGDALKILPGIPYLLTVVVICITALIYMVTSGYWGVVWTDLIQGSVIMAALLCTIPLVFKSLGGVGQALEVAKTIDPDLLGIPGPLPWGLLFSYSFVWGLVAFGQPQLVTKFIALKDAKSVGMTIFISTVWMSLFLIAATVIGFGGRLIFGDQFINNPDLVSPSVAKLGPKFIVMLFSCGVVAAGLTSLAALVLTSATAISRDFYEDGWLRRQKNASSRKINSVKVHRLSVGAIIIITLLLSIRPWSFVWQLSVAGAGSMAAAFTAPLLIGIYWKRATKEGCLASILGGTIVTTLWYLLKLEYFHPYIPGMIVSIVLFIVVSLMTTPPSEATIKKMFPFKA